MSKIDIIRCYYEPRLCENSSDHAVLGWENREAQLARFGVLLSNVRLEGKSLLDLGCGLGNLLEFIKQNGKKVQYTGVDILEDMILSARRKNPDAEFVLGDVFTEDLFSENSFDVVYSSGLFNLNLGNNREFLPFAFKRILSLAGETVVLNFLHKRSSSQEEGFFYYHPDEVIGLVKPLLKQEASVQLEEEYLPNDFTIIIHKGSAGN